MSYETHVTMAINCIATSIYVYAVFELITVCLTMIIFASKNVPPTDFFSMLFNVWFSLVTVVMVTILRSLLFALFFPDSVKEKPICAFSSVGNGKNILNYSMYENKDEAIRLGGYLFNTNIAAQLPSVAKPVDSNPAKTAQTPPKSPGTPDSSAEERSQAETETYAEVKSEIKPCVD